MATKVIVVGQPEFHPPKLKKIELLSVVSISEDGGTAKVYKVNDTTASLYRFVELISRDYHDELDLIFCYDNQESRDGVLYIGRWNDGIV